MAKVQGFFWLHCTLILCLLPQKIFAEPSTSLIHKIVNLAPDISPKVAGLAVQASQCATHTGDEKLNLEKLAIIDYSLPSTTKRFWLFDLKDDKLLLKDLVAHGKNSGEDLAEKFSNEPGSLQSSLGLFQVGNRYIGKHGISLRLIGLEPGINDLAYERAIVLHGADYVDTKFISSHKRLGRSFGCPAMSPESASKVIEYMEKSGGFLFSYYPDEHWLKNSSFLNSCSVAM